MKTEADYAALVKGLLKAELKRRNLTYDELARRLTERGFPESAENISNKISRGKFTAVFMIQCLDAIGCKSLNLVEL